MKGIGAWVREGLTEMSSRAWRGLDGGFGERREWLVRATAEGCSGYGEWGDEGCHVVDEIGSWMMDGMKADGVEGESAER